MSDAKLTVDPTVRYFGYFPIDGLAWAAMSVYIVIGAFLAWVSIKHPPNKYMIVLVLSAWFEALGYGLRVMAAHDPSIKTFILPTLIILLVPNAMALVNYIVVGRALAFSGLNVACLRPHWIARTFLASDIISFVVQGLGGSLLTSDNKSTIEMGKNIILIGLAVQAATLFLFLFVAANVHIKAKYLLSDKPDGIKFIHALYITTVLMLIRAVFRVVEYGEGKSGYLQTHEWTLYVFDCLAIMASLIISSIPAYHYGRCLNTLTEQCAAIPSDASIDVEAVKVNKTERAVQKIEVQMAR